MAKRTTAASVGDPAVAAVFDSYPPRLRKKLKALRALILKTAADTDGVGPLTETLKWGQPSYLTEATGSGTTVRIDAVKGAPHRYALYVHCQTRLVEAFRELYPDQLTYEGNRAILFDANRPVPETPLRHCIAMALTYHARKKAKPLSDVTTASP
ncbi:DUF1801 domain-containing protein [Bauldia sp.]|uniref:DUF1801 domain-containing protein n=1 Tax=Bauldia sp. TaxID=2575872 RepID=UPI003BAB08EA